MFIKRIDKNKIITVSSSLIRCYKCGKPMLGSMTKTGDTSISDNDIICDQCKCKCKCKCKCECEYESETPGIEGK